MKLNSTLLFSVFLFLLKIPYFNKIVLTFYVNIGTRSIIGDEKSNKNKSSVFIIYEPRFKYIINELKEKGYKVRVISRGIFYFLFQKNLAEYIEKNKGNFGLYALDAYEKYKVERANYTKDCISITNLFKSHFNISVIILPKYNDDYTLELAHAFNISGFKTVIYDREGTVSKKRLEKTPLIVSRMAIYCNHIITYNKLHKSFFEKVFSLSNIAKPEIQIIGNPASDEWFLDDKLTNEKSKELKPGHKRILFFAFGEYSYVYDSEYLEGKDEVWRNLLIDIHNALMEHLSDYPEDELKYKRGPKGNRDYWPNSKSLLELPNVNLIPSMANSNLLIVESEFILAFQTTALIDAMHTDKIIIYCAWGINYEELKDGLINFEEYACDGAILHARSPKELKYFLSLDPREIVINIKARKEIRELFTSNPDGKVAKKFVSWFAKTYPR